MKILGLEVWGQSEGNVSTFFDRLEKETFDYIVLFGQNEWQYYIAYSTVLDRAIEEVCVKRNQNLYIFTGASIINEIDEPTLHPLVKLIKWSEWYFIKTYAQMCTYAKNNNVDYNKNVNIDDYKYHYISLNNRAHMHRCHMMDILAKYNLIDKGAISWANVHNSNGYDYPWQYWTPQILQLGTYEANNKAWGDIPTEYYESFVSLINESTINSVIFSEKTVFALVCGQPFICVSGPGHHKFLESMGFELYDELFDYSFDSETNNNKRTELVVQNIDRLCKLPISELTNLKKQIRPKLIRNKQRVKDIALSPNSYCNIIEEVLKLDDIESATACGWIWHMFWLLKDCHKDNTLL